MDCLWRFASVYGPTSPYTLSRAFSSRSALLSLPQRSAGAFFFSFSLSFSLPRKRLGASSLSLSPRPRLLYFTLFRAGYARSGKHLASFYFCFFKTRTTNFPSPFARFCDAAFASAFSLLLFFFSLSYSRNLGASHERGG